uniref:Uncharacterized protein n=1 Tax=Ciona intestinalis TaxID=7719 RepID=H2XV13_CIOIN
MFGHYSSLFTLLLILHRISLQNSRRVKCLDYNCTKLLSGGPCQQR